MEYIGYTALLGRLFSGNALFPIAVTAALCTILGNYLGAGFAVNRAPS